MPSLRGGYWFIFPWVIIQIPSYDTTFFKHHYKGDYEFQKALSIIQIYTVSYNPFCTLTDSPKDLSRKVEDDIIIFTDVQPGSSAVYQCNISNEYGYVLSNAFVNVLCEFTALYPFAFECHFHLYWFLEGNNMAIMLHCSRATQSANTTQ